METQINDYTEDEWFLLTSTPSIVGSAMAAAGRSGLIGSMKEAFASVKTLTGAKKAYPDNDLIASLLSQATNRQEALEKAKAYRDKAVARLKEHDVNSAEELAGLAVEDCRAVSQILDTKATPDQAEQYKAWAMSVAQNVAEAAKEGGFFGIGGERVSEQEQALLDQVSSALGVQA